MNDERWIKEKDGSAILTIHLQPRSSRNEVVAVHGGALKIRLTSAPVDGAANAMLIKFMSKRLGVPRSDIEIVSGEKSRKKVLSVEGISIDKVSELLI